MKDAIGWAVVGSDGNLWSDTCPTSPTVGHLRVYLTEADALKHLVLQDDLVVKVKLVEVK